MTTSIRAITASGRVAALLIGTMLSISACSRPAAGGSRTTAGPKVFAAGTAIPASLTLLAADGDVGRRGAISSDYRPQVRFANGPAEPTCRIELPAASPTLEPGQTATASLKCDAEVCVDPSKPELVLLEGGRQVGKGSVAIQ